MWIFNQIRVCYNRDGELNVATLASVATPKKSLSHLTSNERAALSALVDRLRQRYSGDLLRVVLFGSKARGDDDAESDLDVLIVLRFDDADYLRHRKANLDATYDLELDYGVVLSLLIVNEQEYLQMRRDNLLLNRNIEADGIVLWTSRPSVPIST